MIRIVLYKDDDGSVPVRDFLDSVSEKAKAKLLVRLGRLRELGHQLRRPEADFLCDGIYELRMKLGHVNYRLLYFFHGNVAAVLACGFTKQDQVPPVEIEQAKQRKAKFERTPQAHSNQEQE